jgi:hypothetical protein
VLSADGHVSLVKPQVDFFRDSTQGSVKSYMWDSGDDYSQKPPKTGHSNWNRYLPGL